MKIMIYYQELIIVLQYPVKFEIIKHLNNIYYM